MQLIVPLALARESITCWRRVSVPGRGRGEGEYLLHLCSPSHSATPTVTHLTFKDPHSLALPSREKPQFSDVLSLLSSQPRLPRYCLALPPPRLHLSVGTVSGAQSPRFCWWETRDRTKGRSHVPASRWSRGMGDNGRGLYTSDLSVEDSKPARASLNVTALRAWARSLP